MLFGRYGDVESISILEPKGQQAGSAFVQFKKWAACEAAIDQLNEQYVMSGSDHPLILKFADARRADTLAATSAGSGQQNSSDSSQSQGYVTPQYTNGSSHNHGGYVSGYSSAQSHGSTYNGGSGGGGKRGNGALHNNGNSPVAMAPPNMHYMTHHPGMIPHGAYIGHPSELAHHLTMQYHHAAAAHSGHPAAMGIPLSRLPGTPGLLHGGGRRRGGKAGSSSGAPSSRRGIGSSCDNASTDSLGDISDGSDIQQHFQAGGVPPLASVHHPMAAMHDMNGTAMHHQYMHAMPAAYMGYPMMNMHPMMGMPPGGKVGRGVVDPGVYAHKLFVGQVPFEATEQDLWMIFSPFGDILELAVLRSGGMSKGCAFLTYASKQQALNAMTALHGHHVGPNKRLVVKFADHKAQTSGSILESPATSGASVVPVDTAATASSS